MTDLNKYKMFTDHLSTLKETSLDDRDGKQAYMTQSLRSSVNFDSVKEAYVKNLGLSEIPKSNDALFDDGHGMLVFVEFKNGFIDWPKQFALRKKIYDSVLIFTDITNRRISDMRNTVNYILVYNEEVNEKNPDVIKERKTHIQPSASFNNFAKGVSNLAKEEYVCFGMKQFENYCFKKVHTYTEKEFEKYILSF